ncbi:LVIVD repeat-containing protein [Haloferax chudinovii]|uniref:LVIVD repeat-containing protein n=1 Tax=Haloferax chudinovii TaxID=1109010 RepID=A0ABD5XH27_9EURY
MDRRQFLRTVSASALAASTASVAGSRPATAHPGPFEPLGRIDIDGAKEAVVSADGETVFVAATDGYAAVDISAPDRPELLADRRDPRSDREDGPFRGLYDAKLDGDTLLVVGPANPIPGAPAGVLVVDVSDPANPDEIAFHETGFPIHNCFAADGRAYLTANDGDRNPLVVLDIDSGDELGRWSVVAADDRWTDVSPSVRSVHDVWVREGVAHVALWDAGTWLVDLSDPASPSVLGAVSPGDPEELAALTPRGRHRERRTPPGNHHYVATDDAGDLLGVGVESWAVEVDRDDGTTELVGGPGGVQLWDVSDPAAPTRLSTIEPPASPDPRLGGVWTTAHNFDFRDDRLYTSWYRGGVKRHDVSDATDPVELAWWRDPDRASFWSAQYAYPFADEGVFVASSRGVGDASPALYTFPDHAGDQLDPPSLGPETTTESLVNTPTPTASGTPPSASDTDSSTSATDAPGFGLGVGAAALGVAGWLARRRGRRD